MTIVAESGISPNIDIEAKILHCSYSTSQKVVKVATSTDNENYVLMQLIKNLEKKPVSKNDDIDKIDKIYNKHVKTFPYTLEFYFESIGFAGKGTKTKAEKSYNFLLKKYDMKEILNRDE